MQLSLNNEFKKIFLFVTSVVCIELNSLTKNLFRKKRFIFFHIYFSIINLPRSLSQHSITIIFPIKKNDSQLIKPIFSRYWNENFVWRCSYRNVSNSRVAISAGTVLNLFDEPSSYKSFWYSKSWINRII